MLVLLSLPVVADQRLMHRPVLRTAVQPSKHLRHVVAVVLMRVLIIQQVGFVVSDPQELLDHVPEQRVLPDQVQLQHQVLGHASVLLHQRQPFRLAVEHQLLHQRDSIVLLIPEQPSAVERLNLDQSFQRLLQLLGREDPSVLEYPVELHQVVQQEPVAQQPVQQRRCLVVLVLAELTQRDLSGVQLVRLFQQLVLLLRFQPDLIRCQTVHQLHAGFAVQQVADQSSAHQLINQRLALHLGLTFPAK